MIDSNLYHVVVYTPLPHVDAVRAALAEAGAGKIGNYDGCSFSMRGTGRFRPNEDAHPAMGSSGTLEEVDEERIEVVVSNENLKQVLTAVKNVHPYEEPAIHVLPMLDYKNILEK